MSNVWLNIRFWIWHLQAGDPGPWSFNVLANPVHRRNWRFVAIYDFSLMRLIQQIFEPNEPEE
jgi:hypothetical protein